MISLPSKLLLMPDKRMTGFPTECCSFNVCISPTSACRKSYLLDL
ncbi:Uncharacterised protein [Vibrio cholerae]|nr:Uncharacterised protein [Vibrio cholerae]CSI30443.1 Uncharacterised protein [Vibrio cholerae]